jgi:hypothetical protein
MTAHGIAVRSLGIATVLYALALAWSPVSALRAASTAGEAMSAVVDADPATRDALATRGKTPREVREAIATSYRDRVLAAVAPDLAIAALGAVAGVLLVFRRRAGSWLLLSFLAWPGFGWGFRRMRDAIHPVKAQLAFLPGPLDREIVRIHALGRVWEVDAGAFALGVQLAFTAVALVILAWAYLAESRARRELEL